MEQLSLKWVVTVAGTIVTYLLGGWDAVMLSLFALVCLDYVTGVLAAWVRRRLSSEVGARGIARKIGIFVVIAVANMIDRADGIGEPILRTMVAWFYLFNEALSVLENLSEMGVQIPPRLLQAIGRMQDRGGGPGS